MIKYFSLLETFNFQENFMDCVSNQYTHTHNTSQTNLYDTNILSLLCRKQTKQTRLMDRTMNSAKKCVFAAENQL